jgi:hypothetical protein
MCFEKDAASLDAVSVLDAAPMNTVSALGVECSNAGVVRSCGIISRQGCAARLSVFEAVGGCGCVVVALEMAEGVANTAHVLRPCFWGHGLEMGNMDSLNGSLLNLNVYTTVS